MLLNRARGSNPLVPTDHGIKTPPDKKGGKSGGVPNVWKDYFRTIHNRSRIIIAYYFCEKCESLRQSLIFFDT